MENAQIYVWMNLLGFEMEDADRGASRFVEQIGFRPDGICALLCHPDFFHQHRGMEEEYRRRHDALWPEMKEMIHQYGGKNYSIFLDRETLTLFGYIEIESEEKWSRSAETAICQKWWAYMADIMDTNPDNSPVSIDLVPVFHLD